MKNSRHAWNLCGANSEEFKAGVESLWSGRNNIYATREGDTCVSF